MITFRRLVPQSSVDNADNAGVCEIADQSPDTLLELDNHFGNADIHQSVLCDGTLILDNWIGDRERKPENDHIGKAFSFNADTFPICARPQKHGVRIFLKLIQHLVLRRSRLLHQDFVRKIFLTENGVDLFHVGLCRKQHECLSVGNAQDLKQSLHTLFNEGFMFSGRVREIVAIVDHGVFIVWIWGRLWLG